MARSRRFTQLLNRVAFLENRLLPPERLNGNYPKLENDLIKSYLLLVHAELESYFEDKVRDLVSRSLTSWRNHRKNSTCLNAILAFSGNEINYQNEPKVNSRNIDFRINKAVTHFLNCVNKNNGVKSNDIIDLLIPIGIEYNLLDQAWLSVMDSFGSTRGNIAHSSIRVQQQLDRNTERDRINNQIIPEIERIDQLIQRLS